MQILSAGAIYHEEILTSDVTGALADVDSSGVPAIIVNRNGTDDGSAAFTAAKVSAGRYKVTGTVPATYSNGDVLNITWTATCSGIACGGKLESVQVYPILASASVLAVVAAAVASIKIATDKLNSMLESA